MRNYTATAKAVNPRRTVPQTQPLVGREAEMVKNNAGGFVFPVSIWTSLDRYLILGAEGPTYYVSAQKLSLENAQNVIKCIEADGVRVVNRIVEISDAGRAPKNDPALFALALVMTFGDADAKSAAFVALPQVARIGTHLLHLAAYVDTMRGWGRGIRNAFGNWYLTQKSDKLAMNLVKYANRDGWTHRDVLRLAHPKAVGATQQLLGYVTDKPYNFRGTEIAGFMNAVAQIKTLTPAEEKLAAKLITDYELPREVIPTELLNSKRVWEALLPHMGITALVRNLATLTRIGVIENGSQGLADVLEKLRNEEAVRKSRFHPIQALAALLTYKAGHGARGTNTWTPVIKLVDELDSLFYRSFGNVVPTGKRILYGLDISGSMDGGEVAGVPGLTPRVAAGALAMLAAQTEQDAEYLGFTASGLGWRYNTSASEDVDSAVTAIDISKKHRLDTVCHMMDALPMGRTDCAVPALWATKHNRKFDAFVIVTDNECYAGAVHPAVALQQYRNKSGIPAKMVAVALVAGQFDIGDPNDAGSLSVVGFDTAAPNVISDFIRGE